MGPKNPATNPMPPTMTPPRSMNMRTLIVMCFRESQCDLTTKVSGRRRQGRWSARGASELPPSVERTSGAAVRSSDLVSRHSIPPPVSCAIQGAPLASTPIKNDATLPSSAATNARPQLTPTNPPPEGRELPPRASRVLHPQTQRPAQETRGMLDRSTAGTQKEIAPRLRG